FRNIITPFFGFIDSFFIIGKKRQRLGDKLVRTVVVVH
ncbi:RDD family protein, partial [Vibrio diabolicus]